MTKGTQQLRTSDAVLADLDLLRDRRYAHLITEQEYREQHDILWDELREGDRARHNAEMRKQKRAEDRKVLAQHGYKSIKQALADGWVKERPSYPFFGGERIELTNHTLLRGYKIGRSMTDWKAQGYRIKDGEQPSGSRYWRIRGIFYTFVDLYTDEQVERIDDYKRRRREEIEQKKKEKNELSKILEPFFARYDL